MRPTYLYKDEKDFSRKVLIDMPYLSEHKKIRLPKYQFEDQLYMLIPANGNMEKYYLSQEKMLKEDSDFVYFSSPLKKKDLMLLEKLN